MVEKGKNSKTAEEDLPMTNDAQYNEMVRTLKRLKEKSALRKTAEPHEEAAVKPEVDNASRKFILATNDMYTRHGSFPLDSYSDNFTNEQRRAYRKLYTEIQSERQRLQGSTPNEPRHFETLKDFGKAFGVKLPGEKSEKKMWMPKKYTKLVLNGKVVPLEELRAKKGSSVHEAEGRKYEDDEAGNEPEKKTEIVKIEDS
ncbi:hypothetical protein KCU73_g7790, partial [Aureobasidium melanogenum]